jgi:dTMP kinase
MPRGKLITIEGVDGAGKTTLARRLVDWLEEQGQHAEVLREPGGVPAAERIRTLVKDPELPLTARAEALLYAAARAQLVEERLEPMLDGETWVLLDRFVDSSLAYQGAGRGLGIDRVRSVNQLAAGDLRPDRTLLLNVDPGVGRERSTSRGTPADRLEREPDQFFDRIAAAYRQLAAAEPERFREIDAGQPPDAVLVAAQAALADLL